MLEMSVRQDYGEADADLEQIENKAQAVLDTLPRLGLARESAREERIAKIFGLKVSQLGQLSRRVKETHPKLIKTVIKSLRQLGLRRDIPKEQIDTTIVTRIFSCHDYRKEMLVQNFEAEISGNKLKSKPPVLEYELIKAWNPAYDFTGWSSEGFHLEKAGAQNFFKLTHTSQYISGMPTILEKRFALIADQLLVDLSSWENKSDGEKDLIAGAAFAVASAVSNIALFLAFNYLAPGLTRHLYLENSAWCEKASEYTFDDANGQSKVIERKVFSSISMLEEFCYSHDLRILEGIRSDLDFYEKEVLDQGVSDIDKLNEFVTNATSELEGVVELFKAAGTTLDATPIELRIKHLSDLLQLDVMKTPSHERHALINDIGDDASYLFGEIHALRSELESAAREREKTITNQQLTWAEQLELLQQVAETTEEGRKFFSTLCADIQDMEPIEVQQGLESTSGNEEPEICLESQLDALQGEHALQLDAIKCQLEQTNEHNNQLRKECAEAKKQFDMLKLSVAEKVESSPVVTEELIAAIDTLALKASPVEILKLLETLYPDRIEVLESAYSSASEDQPSIPVAAMYQRTKALVTEGLDIIRNTGQIIDCKDVVPGEISVQESNTVRASTKLNNMRHFNYKGSKRAFYPHFRLNHICRVYFDYIAEEQRIVIAYVGRHLPT